MDLARLLAPKDPDLARFANELHENRADLRSALGDSQSAAFCQWLGVHGVREYDRIAAFYPPIPPEELRATACGGATPQSHLLTGVEDFRTVVELFEIFADREITSVRSVLDFGCGCGRLLRWFGTALPECRLVGADVRDASVRWCRDNLDGTFLTNETVPPLDLPDDSVDLTVALSVFSHLSREQGLAWMKELVRVTSPDGLVLVTTHGAFALALIARSASHQSGLKIAAAEVPEMLRDLARDSFLHRVSPSAVARGDGVDDEYGQAFMTEQFARDEWGVFAEVVGCVPVALNLFQDVHLLRPRRRS